MASPPLGPTQPRLIRLVSAGLAGALSAFALPVATAPAKQPPPAVEAAPQNPDER